MSFVSAVGVGHSISIEIPKGKCLVLTQATVETDLKKQLPKTNLFSVSLSSSSELQWGKGRTICVLSPQDRLFSSVIHVRCFSDLLSIQLKVDSQQNVSDSSVVINIFGYWKDVSGNSLDSTNSIPIPTITNQPANVSTNRKRSISSTQFSDQLESQNVYKSKRPTAEPGVCKTPNQSTKPVAPSTVSVGISRFGETDDHGVNHASHAVDRRFPKSKDSSIPPESLALAPDKGATTKAVETKALASWCVKPFGDEGTLNPRPKLQHAQAGVKFTDFVVGKGRVPPAGSKIKILFTCLLSNGDVFDSHEDRSRPLHFFKGTCQVMQGLDIGIESMRVGGCREILVPLEKSSASINSSNQDSEQYIFRVTLVG